MIGKKFITAVLCTGAIGCSFLQPQVEQLSLVKPPRPVLPVIHRTELECLSEQTSDKLGKRNLLLRQYSEQLEVVIDAVNQKE